MSRIKLMIGALSLAAILVVGGAATAGKEKFVRDKPHVNVDTTDPVEDAPDTVEKVTDPVPVEGGADPEAASEAERRVPERLRHKSREASDAAGAGVEVQGWDAKEKEAVVGEPAAGEGTQLSPTGLRSDEDPDTGK